MKRFLLILALLLGFPALAGAQCVGVGGVVAVPTLGPVCNQEPTIDSYSATGVGIAPAASATDIACITGSATRIVRVKQIRISGSAGTLISVPVLIMKRASADTGGTLATGTALPVAGAHDSADAAAGAILAAYTANPTINDTSPGIVDSSILVLNVTTAAGGSAITLTWNQDSVEALTLRGVAQQACVNLNSTSPSSGLVNVSFRWTEATQ